MTEKNILKSDGEAWSYQAEVDELGKAFDLLSDRVMILDRNALIRYANSAMTKKTAYSKEEFVGKNPRDVWGGRMPKEFYGELWYTIKHEKRHFVGEIANQRKDGSEYMEEIHISPVLDETKEAKYFIGVVFDVTNRKSPDGYKDERIIKEKINTSE